MHRIGRVARIHRDNRRSLSVSAAGVVRVITAVLRGLVLPDRQDQGGRTRRRRRPAQLRTGSPGAGGPRLTRGRTRNLTVFAQVKAKREDLST